MSFIYFIHNSLSSFTFHPNNPLIVINNLILNATNISHHIPLFNLLLSIIVYICLFVFLSFSFMLTLLPFNRTTFLHSRSSYTLVATFIMYYNLLLFSSLLVRELPSYNFLYFTFKSFISIIYYIVHHRHITFTLSSYLIILQH